MPQTSPNPPALTPIRPKLPKSSGQFFALCGHAKFALLLFDPAAGYFKPSLCIGHPGYIPWPCDTHIGRTCAPAALEHGQCWEGNACQKLADLVAPFSHRQLAASPWLMHLLARGPGGTGSHCTARLYVLSDKKRGHLDQGGGGGTLQSKVGPWYLEVGGEGGPWTLGLPRQVGGWGGP